MTGREYLRYFSWLFLLAALTMVSASASAQNQDISGVWEFQNGPNFIKMDLKADGTFDWNSNTNGQQSYFNGTWSFSNGYLHVLPAQTNEPEQFPVVWSGANSITVTFDGSPVPLQRTRMAQSRNTQTGQGNQTTGSGSLAGRWVFRAGGTEMVFLLMADKSFDLTITQPDGNQHFTGSYNLQGGQIHLRTDGVPEEEVYPLTFNSADSWTGVFNGNPVTFMREGTLPQVVRNEPVKKPEPKKPIQNKPADPVPVEDPQPQPQERTSVFPNLRPRRPGDAVGNTGGNTGGTANNQTRSGGFLSGGGATVAPDLKGTWYSTSNNERITMEFLVNNRFTYDAADAEGSLNLTGTYTVQGGKINFASDNGQDFSFQFSAQGNDSITINADGTIYQFKRQNNGQRRTSDQGGQAATSTLVGTWRFTSTEMVITAVFNADGSYHLEAGPPGGNPDTDEGTYTVRGNTINFTSNTEEPESGNWNMPDRNTLSIDVAGMALTFQRIR